MVDILSIHQSIIVAAWYTDLLVLAVGTLPLCLTYFALKGLQNSMPGGGFIKDIHGRASSGAQKYGKMGQDATLGGAGKNMKNKFLKNSREGGGGLAGRAVRFADRRKAVSSSLEKGAEEARVDMISEAARKRDGFAKKMAAGDPRRVAQLKAGAISASHAQDSQYVKNMESLLTEEQLHNPRATPQAALASAMASGDTVTARAAQNLLFAQGGGGVDKFRKTIRDNQGVASPEMISSLKLNTSGVHGKAAKEKGKDILNWATTGADNIDKGRATGMTNREVLNQTPRSLAKAISQGALSHEQATEILKDVRLQSDITKEQRAQLNRLTAAGGYRVVLPAGGDPNAFGPAARMPGADPDSSKGDY